MKQFLGLSALAGLLVGGCSTRPEPVGGTFDNNLNPVTIPRPILEPAPQLRSPTPGPSPSELVPEGSNDSSPELMLPRIKVRVYTI